MLSLLTSFQDAEAVAAAMRLEQQIIVADCQVWTF